MFIWGSMRAFDGEQTASPNALARFLERCVELNCAGLDVADIYNRGRSEVLIGEVFRLAPEFADHLPVIAKAGVVFAEARAALPAHHYRNDAEHLVGALEGSLQRLGVDQVDSFLVHRPDYLMLFDETARALEDMVQSGKVRRIGVSNFSVSQLTGLQSTLPVRLAHHQIELSVLEPRALEDGRMDLAATSGQTVTAWSPLGGGRLFDAEDAQARRVRRALAALAASDELDAVAGAALAWIARHPARPVPILGGTEIGRIERQLKAMRSTAFTPESWYAVLEASRGYPVP
jgi:predicted oxidoreductase